MYERERNRDSRPEPMAGQADEGPEPWVRNCLKEAYPLPGGAQGSLFAWKSARNRRPQAIGALRIPASPPVRLPAPGDHDFEDDHAVELTEVSFERGMPPDAIEIDRRADDRATMTVYRVATLRRGEFEALCLIRNISAGGMMGILHKTMAEGEAVTIEIRSGQLIPGRVAWSRDEMVGVSFDERIDVLQVLQAPSTGEPGAIQRMPRLRIGCPSTIQIDQHTQDVALLDVSQGGAKVAGERLRDGDDVILTIAGLDPRRGTVRWTRGGNAGITFIVAIPFDRLARWAIERQADEQAK